MLLIIFACVLQLVTGQYPNFGDAAVVGTSEGGIAGGDSGSGYGERTAPVAPPRVPSIDGPSFGYRPPPPPMRRDAKSAGQCSFDQSSWRLEPQTAIANAIMFDRATGLTCEECITKCLHFQDPNSQWICRSLTFDHRWKICDLFAVNGTNPPHFLTEYSDRDYLEYTRARPPPDARLTHASGTTYETGSRKGNLDTSQTAETGFASSETSAEYQAVHRRSFGKSGEKYCETDDVTRYVTISNHERVNLATDTQLVEAKNPIECAKACDRDETFTCSSAIYTGTDCELSVSSADHKTSDDFISNENSTYLEKACLPASLSEETGKLWPTILDHILVGHVMEVVDAPKLTDCMIACLRAENEFSFVCRSAMWYPNDADQNCLLNSESRETQANVFVAEDQGVRMLYFEVPRLRNQKQKFDTDVFRDDPVEDDYTRWSLCGNSGLQHRYLKCRDKFDVRKCPKQTKSCDQAKREAKNKCLAVRDSRGRKRCPHGIRKLPNGHNEYCKDPIDCDS